MLGKDRFEIGKQGFDEVRAAQVAGGLHLVGDSGTHQAGHGPIQCFAKLDGLEVPGFFVEPGFAQSIEECLNRVEEGRPVEPLWECTGIWPSEEESPFIVAEDREGFFPADADGADMTGCGEVIEDILNGTAEVTGLAGDFRRVSLFVGKQPAHDFGAGLHAEKGPEFEEKGGGLVRAWRLAHAPEYDAAALQAVLEEYGIGFFENGNGGKEPLAPLCGRSVRLFHPTHEKLPLEMGGFFGEKIRDGGEDGGIAEVLVLVQGSKALQVDPGAVGMEPVENFIEQSTVMAGDMGGEEK